jgi:hypothetical protein
MTKAQIDLAHRTVGDLGICARAADQYVNARLATVMRTAASLLQAMVDEYEAAEPTTMVDEYEAAEPTTMGTIDRSPSAVWRNAVEEDSRG